MKFTDFSLAEPLLQAVEDLGFDEPTLIQEQSLPHLLANKDIAGQAQTGTGKTACFLLATLNRLLASERPEDGKPRALMVAPTRELAMQIADDGRELAAHTDIRIALAYGGTNWKAQAESIEWGVDIVVGTPGRLIDYHKSRVLHLDKVEVVVIDEADRMFDMGFIEDLTYLMRHCPHRSKRQAMLYSATLSYRVVSLARNHLNDPVRVSVHPEELVLENIAQELYHVAGREKVSLLLGLIEREQPRRSMVFVNTKRGGEELAWRLNQNNAKAVYISGDLPQNRRSKIIEQMKDGQITMLVATDVASRGLHVEDVTHVFNYDVPQDPEDYIHRIGRTGRVGASGKAITLACDDYVYCLPAIEDFIKMKIPAHQPTDELLADDTSGYYRSQRPTGKGRSRDGKRPRRGGGRRPGRRSDSGGRSHKGNGHGHAKAEERPRQMSSAAKKTAPRKDADSAPRKRVRRRIGDGQGLGE